MTFRYNPTEDAIEIGGHGGFARRKKYRDVQKNPMFRLRPKRIISWGIDGAMSKQNARSVG